VNKDEWTSFTSLNAKIYNTSASILNNKFIYLFGGEDSNDDRIDTIYKYNIIDSEQNWVVLNCKYPKCIMYLNSIPISTTQILVFGGMDGGW